MKMKKVFILALFFLQGCTLQSQLINLNEEPMFNPEAITSNQAALVKVEDNRGTSQRIIGYRGNKQSEQSALNINEPLSTVLTKRMQKTLSNLGFGGEDMADAIRVKLSVEEFNYSCKQTLMTNCEINMKFIVEVLDESSSFKKPYKRNEKRSLATPPIKEYNQQWINKSLDYLWQDIFSDKQLLKRLAKNATQST